MHAYGKQWMRTDSRMPEAPTVPRLTLVFNYNSVHGLAAARVLEFPGSSRIE